MMAFDRVVTLTRQETSGPPFNPTITDVDYATVWGEYREQTIRQRADARIAEGTDVIRVRWRSDIETGHRATIEGGEHEITAITEVGRRRWLDLQIQS